MKATYFSSSDHNFENIISINNQVSDSDHDEFDFDFDYDVNEMYYALQRENQ